MSIFHVLSNLNHNGTHYVKGDFIEGEEPSHFTSLVADGVVEEVPAENLEDAKALLATRQAEQEVASVEEEAKAPEDTWGAQPDPVVEETVPTETQPTDETVSETTTDTTTEENAPIEADPALSGDNL